MTEYIDMTPTWTALMPMMIKVLEDGTEEGKVGVRAELMRIAGVVDAMNEKAKEE